MADAIRVLHIVHGLRGGGAETQLGYLLGALDGSRFASAVCCADSRGGEALPESVRLFEIPRTHRWNQRWARMHKLIRRWSPHVVHNWLPLVLWSSLAPARLAPRTRYLASYRNVYKPESLRRVLQAAGFLLSDRIVSNTHPEDLRFPFGLLYRLRRGVFIPNGFPTRSCGAPVSLETLGLRNDLPTLLFAGRLTGHKNVETIFQALRLLAESELELQLFICGRGPERPALEEAAASVQERFKIRFSGFREDLDSIMRISHCLVHPSLQEGMPNVVFEAMAASLPVVASDIPPHRRWLRDSQNALLFAADDPQALAHCIRRILSDPQLRDRLKLAAAKTVKELSIPRMVAAYESLYREMAAGRSLNRNAAVEGERP